MDKTATCKHYKKSRNCCEFIVPGYGLHTITPCNDPFAPKSPCEHYSPITNYDRIKRMSVEELAEFLCGVYDLEDVVNGKFLCGAVIPGYDTDSVKEWLEMEVDHG